jgi:hypothetical protein
MMIEKILKPKTQEEIDKNIDEILGDSLNIVQLLQEYELIKFKRVVRAYDYIAKNLGESPLKVYIIFSDNILYDTINNRYLNSHIITNSVRENIRIDGGPFYRILIWKNKIATSKGILQALMISRKQIQTYLTWRY